ncbi:MAG TPA: DUF1993 family protein [Paracoccaceae bacterium]
MTLYAASVPVFRYYLGRAGGMVALAPDAALTVRLADAMTAGAQFATAAGYALRVAFPLAGRAVPPQPEGPLTVAGLRARFAAVDALLAGLPEAEFADAGARVIRHHAGFAELDQDGATFLQLYGMPNFMFHLTMGYATLRAEGVPLGKADFDGQHDYPPGFRFS